LNLYDWSIFIFNHGGSLSRLWNGFDPKKPFSRQDRQDFLDFVDHFPDENGQNQCARGAQVAFGEG